MENIEQEIIEIKNRNKRVEADKAWEVSWTRRILIICLTYVVIVLFFVVTKLPNPFINAIVPTVGYLLSTLTISLAKKWWLQKHI